MFMTWISRAVRALVIAAFAAAMAFGGATLATANTGACPDPDLTCTTSSDCDPPVCMNGGLCDLTVNCCRCLE